MVLFRPHVPAFRPSLRIILPFILAASAVAAPRPRLVVVISVDQLSEELMERWGKDLPGGLGRLYRQGTTFTAAYQDHGFTETGPGHSVILSGRHPAHTGIVENSWLDRKTGKLQYCVSDPDVDLVTSTGIRSGKASSPRYLEGDTLGAWLLDAIPGSRVFALTGKDRSAILMAGHRAQGVFWFGGADGFCSSTAYTRSLPGWLNDFNTAWKRRMAVTRLTWEPLDAAALPPGGTYTIHGKPFVMGLPRVLLAEGKPQDRTFWDDFKGSPYLDQTILNAAEALEAGEHLGQGPGVDLLALGLSATDYIGHGFGNAGPEMMDQMRRLDLELGKYLDRLQAKVPGLWVALTADHACRDFPERLQAKGIPAKRLMGAQWQRNFNETLSRRLGCSEPLFMANPGSHQLYLKAEGPRLCGKSRAEILAAAVAVAKATPEVAEACSADELDAYRPDLLEAPAIRSYRARLSLSYKSGRSGDLLLAFKPEYTMDDPEHIACHGHPEDYDRKVPLVFMGPWRRGERKDPVRIVDLAPTLARELGIKPKDKVDGRALDLPAAP